MSKIPLTVALIPAYEEEATIAKVVLQTRKHIANVIVCDDGSRDMTGKIAEALGATVIRHKGNLGKGAALRTLFTKAKKTNAEYIITLDADGQHEPSEIPRLVRAMRASHADILVGSRFIENGTNNSSVPRHRALGNKLLNILTDGHISDTQSGFRIYRKAVLDLIMPKAMKMDVDSVILMRAREEGLRIVEVPIRVNYDVPNPSKQAPLVNASEVVFGVLKYLSSRRPRLFYGVPAIAVLVVALGFWIRLAQMLTSTGQIQGDIAAVAIGASIISLNLFAVSMILLRLIRAVRETATRGILGPSDWKHADRRNRDKSRRL